VTTTTTEDPFEGLNESFVNEDFDPFYVDDYPPPHTMTADELWDEDMHNLTEAQKHLGPSAAAGESRMGYDELTKGLRREVKDPEPEEEDGAICKQPILHMELNDTAAPEDAAPQLISVQALHDGVNHSFSGNCSREIHTEHGFEKSKLHGCATAVALHAECGDNFHMTEDYRCFCVIYLREGASENPNCASHISNGTCQYALSVEAFVGEIEGADSQTGQTEHQLEEHAIAETDPDLK
jgi:hypothetical protein